MSMAMHKTYIQSVSDFATESHPPTCGMSGGKIKCLLHQMLDDWIRDAYDERSVVVPSFIVYCPANPWVSQMIYCVQIEKSETRNSMLGGKCMRHWHLSTSQPSKHNNASAYSEPARSMGLSESVRICNSHQHELLLWIVVRQRESTTSYVRSYQCQIYRSMYREFAHWALLVRDKATRKICLVQRSGIFSARSCSCTLWHS